MTIWFFFVSGVFLEARSFDTYADSSSGYHLRDYLNSLSGKYVTTN